MLAHKLPLNWAFNKIEFYDYEKTIHNMVHSICLLPLVSFFFFSIEIWNWWRSFFVYLIHFAVLFSYFCGYSWFHDIFMHCFQWFCCYLYRYFGVFLFSIDDIIHNTFLLDRTTQFVWHDIEIYSKCFLMTILYPTVFFKWKTFKCMVKCESKCNGYTNDVPL